MPATDQTSRKYIFNCPKAPLQGRYVTVQKVLPPAVGTDQEAYGYAEIAEIYMLDEPEPERHSMIHSKF